ncbi:DUF7519 family protein [Haloferacaceae archaeon DSL9]
MTDIDRSPTKLSSALAFGAAFFGVLGLALGSVEGAAVAALGVVGVGIGTVTGGRRWVTRGAVLVFAGTLVAGALGAPAIPLLFGGLSAILTWDFGTFAIELGDHLGRGTETARLEAVHAGISVAVGAITASVGYGTYLAAVGGQPVTALVFLLFGAVILVSALR